VKILAAIDLREDYTWMIKQTADWAERLDATIDLIYVSQHPKLSLDQASRSEHDRKRLESLLAFAPRQHRGTCILSSGTPAAAIVAQSKGYGLLVVATHGRTGVGRVVMGSVAESVVRLPHPRPPTLAAVAAPETESQLAPLCIQNAPPSRPGVWCAIPTAHPSPQPRSTR
jgi:nucleotide-binding universal stress UspA family protein